MAALEIGLDAQSLKAINELKETVNSALTTLQLMIKAISPDADDWLTAAHLCEKYDISRSTLTRRVKDGKIERREFDDGIIRYRMAGGEV